MNHQTRIALMAASIYAGYIQALAAKDVDGTPDVVRKVMQQSLLEADLLWKEICDPK